MQESRQQVLIIIKKNNQEVHGASPVRTCAANRAIIVRLTPANSRSSAFALVSNLPEGHPAAGLDAHGGRTTTSTCPSRSRNDIGWDVVTLPTFHLCCCTTSACIWTARIRRRPNGRLIPNGERKWRFPLAIRNVQTPMPTISETTRAMRSGAGAAQHATHH